MRRLHEPISILQIVRCVDCGAPCGEHCRLAMPMPVAGLITVCRGRLLTLLGSTN